MCVFVNSLFLNPFNLEWQWLGTFGFQFIDISLSDQIIVSLFLEILHPTCSTILLKLFLFSSTLFIDFI